MGCIPISSSFQQATSTEYTVKNQAFKRGVCLIVSPGIKPFQRKKYLMPIFSRSTVVPGGYFLGPKKLFEDDRGEILKFQSPFHAPLTGRAGKAPKSFTQRSNKCNYLHD